MNMLQLELSRLTGIARAPGHRYDGGMDFDVSAVKSGQVLATERVINPGEGDISDAITRVMGEARKKLGATLWPAQIDVREV